MMNEDVQDEHGGIHESDGRKLAAVDGWSVKQNRYARILRSKTFVFLLLLAVCFVAFFRFAIPRMTDNQKQLLEMDIRVYYANPEIEPENYLVFQYLSEWLHFDDVKHIFNIFNRPFEISFNSDCISKSDAVKLLEILENEKKIQCVSINCVGISSESSEFQNEKVFSHFVLNLPSQIELLSLSDWQPISSKNVIDDDLLQAMTNGFYNLQVLVLSSQGIGNEGLARFSSLKNLVCLEVAGSDVRGNLFDDKAITILSNMDSLEILSLPHAKIDGGTLGDLQKLKSLHTLNLSGNKILAEHVHFLSQISSLRTLYITFGKLPGEKISLSHLASLSQVTDIQILGNEISDDELFEIREVMSNCNLHVEQTTAAAVYVGHDAAFHFRSQFNE